ncbi:hypothetical protein VSR34_22320 [Paraburkholderia sp. JHI2823]|uniref:hypothetical protein n=1 Tax=Paraburkholderia sp. JHI2823 TaxID=3112960 RepID=UPI003180404C
MKGLIHVIRTTLLVSTLILSATALTGCGGGKFGGTANGSAFLHGIAYTLLVS